MSDFGDYFREIYAHGLLGEQPAIPVSFAELEEAAAQAMDERAAAYVFAGAGSEDTMRANLEAFRRWRIVPRMMRDVAARDLSRTVLGTAMPAPLVLAPIGIHKIVHEEGEPATARAAARVGLPLIASTASHSTLEEIAAASGEGPRWFQLYWPNDDEIAASFVRRAEAAGYAAIVAHRRHLHLRLEAARPAAGLAALPGGDRERQLLPGPGLPLPAREDPRGGSRRCDRPLRRRLRQPVADLGEARAAARDDLAADPRQGHPAPRRRARGGRARRSTGSSSPTTAGARSTARSPRWTPCRGSSTRWATSAAVLLDSGIRGGADAFKALALGADAVLLGRPYIWGLALGGEQGVETVLRMLLAELDLTMALSGHTRLGELGPGALVRNDS